MRKPIIITGAAGFIGSSLCIKLLNNGFNVIGLDNVNDYYDVELKKKRLENINNIADGCWEFYKYSLEDYDKINKLFGK